MTTINDWIKRVGENAYKKGWYEKENDLLTLLEHIEEEVQEAKNDIDMIDYGILIDKDNKPFGFKIELADIALMLFSLCYNHGINLEEALEIKQDWNEKYRK